MSDNNSSFLNFWTDPDDMSSLFSSDVLLDLNDMDLGLAGVPLQESFSLDVHDLYGSRTPDFGTSSSSAEDEQETERNGDLVLLPTAGSSGDYVSVQYQVDFNIQMGNIFNDNPIAAIPSSLCDLSPLPASSILPEEFLEPEAKRFSGRKEAELSSNRAPDIELSSILHTDADFPPILHPEMRRLAYLDHHTELSSLLSEVPSHSSILEPETGSAPMATQKMGQPSMLGQEIGCPPSLGHVAGSAPMPTQEEGQSLMLEPEIGYSPSLERVAEFSPMLNQEMELPSILEHEAELLHMQTQQMGLPPILLPEVDPSSMIQVETGPSSIPQLLGMDDLASSSDEVNLVELVDPEDIPTLNKVTKIFQELVRLDPNIKPTDISKISSHFSKAFNLVDCQPSSSEAHRGKVSPRNVPRAVKKIDVNAQKYVIENVKGSDDDSDEKDTKEPPVSTLDDSDDLVDVETVFEHDDSMPYLKASDAISLLTQFEATQAQLNTQDTPTLGSFPQHNNRILSDVMTLELSSSTQQATGSVRIQRQTESLAQINSNQASATVNEVPGPSRAVRTRKPVGRSQGKRRSSRKVATEKPVAKIDQRPGPSRRVVTEKPVVNSEARPGPSRIPSERTIANTEQRPGPSRIPLERTIANTEQRPGSSRITSSARTVVNTEQRPGSSRITSSARTVVNTDQRPSPRRVISSEKTVVNTEQRPGPSRIISSGRTPVNTEQRPGSSRFIPSERTLVNPEQKSGHNRIISSEGRVVNTEQRFGHSRIIPSERTVLHTERRPGPSRIMSSTKTVVNMDQRPGPSRGVTTERQVLKSEPRPGPSRIPAQGVAKRVVAEKSVGNAKNNTEMKPHPPAILPKNDQKCNNLPIELIARINNEARNRRTITVIPPKPNVRKRAAPRNAEPSQPCAKIQKVEHNEISTSQMIQHNIKLDHNYCIPQTEPLNALQVNHPPRPNNGGVAEAMKNQPIFKNADGQLMVSVLKCNTLRMNNGEKKKLNLEEYKRRRLMVSKPSTSQNIPPSNTNQSQQPEDETLRRTRYEEKLKEMTAAVLNAQAKSAAKSTIVRAESIHKAQERVHAGIVNRRQERVQAGVVHREQERVQAGVVHKVQERVQAGVVHKVQERVQAEIVHRGQDKVRAEIVHREQARVQAEVVHREQKRVQAEVAHKQKEKIQAEVVHKGQETVQERVVLGPPIVIDDDGDTVPEVKATPSKTFCTVAINTDDIDIDEELETLRSTYGKDCVQSLAEIAALMAILASYKINSNSLLSLVIENLPFVNINMLVDQDYKVGKRSSKKQETPGSRSVGCQTFVTLMEKYFQDRYRRRNLIPTRERTRSRSPSISSLKSASSVLSTNSIRSTHSCSGSSPPRSLSPPPRSRSPPPRSRSPPPRSRSPPPRSYHRKSPIYSAELKRQVEERRVVYVGRIEHGCTKEELKAKFRHFGTIVEVSLHFRRSKDNYGFLTFENKEDAYQAVEHGNDQFGERRYELSFGGRRIFCQTDYADLDNVNEVDDRYYQPNRDAEALSYDAMLKEYRETVRNRKT